MTTRSSCAKRGGFTLIELLIVVAVIAILAAAVFVALDPIQRFEESRDSARWSDVSNVASAVGVDQVDNGGSYLASIAALTAGTAYQIGTAATGMRLRMYRANNQRGLC